MAPPDNETRVVREALIAEADKWSRLSKDMKNVKTAVDGLDIQETAFFPIPLPLAAAANKAYQQIWHHMSTLAQQGADEFNQINEALHRASDRYQAADESAKVDLTQIYGQ